MRRPIASLLVLPLIAAFGLLALAFPAGLPHAADVTATPTFRVYLPHVMRAVQPTPTPTVTSTPTATPTATATARPSPTAPSEGNVHCQDYAGGEQICAWVSNTTPSRYSYVTVYGRLLVGGAPIGGAAMHTVWHYKTTTPTEDCITAADGIGRCTRNIGGATVGYTVRVDVSIAYQGNTYSTYTSFVPK